MSKINNNPVYKVLRDAGVQVTPEQVESYTKYKFMREQYYRVISQVATQIYMERYNK
jgi:uncharacterized protein YehS (DUF1456 family)